MLVVSRHSGKPTVTQLQARLKVTSDSLFSQSLRKLTDNVEKPVQEARHQL